MRMLAVGKWSKADKQWRAVVAIHQPPRTSDAPLRRPERPQGQLQRSRHTER